MPDFPQTLFAHSIGIRVPNDDEAFRERLREVFEEPDVSRLPVLEMLERQQAEPGLHWHPLEVQLLDKLLTLMQDCGSCASDEVKMLRELFQAGNLLPMKTRRVWRRGDGQIGQAWRHWCLKTKRLFIDRTNLVFFPEIAAFSLLSGGVLATSNIRTKEHGAQVLMHSDDVQAAERRIAATLEGFADPWRLVLAKIGFKEADIDAAIEEGLRGI